LALAEDAVVLEHRTRAIRARLRGDEVVAMENFGADLAFSRICHEAPSGVGGAVRDGVWSSGFLVPDRRHTSIETPGGGTLYAS
jgi:hypothetical protein